MKIRGVVLILLLLAITTCKETPNALPAINQEKVMKASFDSFIKNAWNMKNMDSLRSVTVDEYVRELNGIKVAENLNELKANMNIYFTGFPDVIISIDHSTIKDDQLFTQWTFEGTNTGTFGESIATGKHVVISGYSEITFDPMGKISIEKIYYNELALLQQLGYSLAPPIVE